MKIIGRTAEKKELDYYFASRNPEFLVVYGRRRVGKTYLIREYFKDGFFFYHTGVANQPKNEQLAEFCKSLERCCGHTGRITCWRDAFDSLRSAIENSGEQRKIIFIDEMPWMETPKSGFFAALEHFWNGWASSREDILLIACGSATSWIINKLIRDKGGLYNRITGRLNISPFTLAECEAYYKESGVSYSRYQMVESYMVFGGIPYYLSLMRKELGFNQNVDRLCFDTNALLQDEHDMLYRSLFNSPQGHMDIARALAEHIEGLTREDIIRHTGLGDDGGTTGILRELEQSGFIRKYASFGKKTKGSVYRLCDFFTIFYHNFMAGHQRSNKAYWASLLFSGQRGNWEGHAFERVVEEHVEQLKDALRIGGVESRQFAWHSRQAKPSVQIDLILDRNDGVINICEAKFTNDSYSIDEQYARTLQRRAEVFRAETQTKKALHLTMITSYGVLQNQQSDILQASITMDDLFR